MECELSHLGKDPDNEAPPPPSTTKMCTHGHTLQDELVKHVWSLTKDPSQCFNVLNADEKEKSFSKRNIWIRQCTLINCHSLIFLSLIVFLLPSLAACVSFELHQPTVMIRLATPCHLIFTTRKGPIHSVSAQRLVQRCRMKEWEY